ncbi:MAG: polysulfide reductase NrfD [Candidatus Eisenbacteria bacterium]|uniref:Polysulfide reductase NrfD n=1 Tax=Eiseniibacteriota bacterium TaxID=2212470 RepID=A0A933WA45_UNCEI|nr:polysulfide reductase NrfD [Candidatus Eisenbacteria bacterium]MBK7367368.1 polysulfide reductase NrfD [Candidatus Eisenbacteria bacterium]MBP8136716.1 polysulfide reductase NrfD [Candidatus Eisenbacteria bacterium]
MVAWPGKVWWALFLFDLVVLAVALAAVRNLIVHGWGVSGFMRPVMWAVDITNFVFWVGIAHCGTLVSAVLFLFRSHFRRAVYRIAEAMTVFGVLTAAMFPAIHTGRPWFDYWLFPYPNQRQLWTNIRSPLEWDVFAVNTYLTVSSIFFLVGLIPDCAAARDRAKHPILKLIYTIFSFGWTGANYQWKHFYGAYLFFAALATPLVFSVHSVVSWDFAMAQTPGWHSTLFAPYFVAGAIFSGVGMVIFLLVIIRKGFGLQHLVTIDHMEKLAKLVLLTSCMVGYSYLTEFFMAWYGPSAAERDVFWFRATGHYWWAFWIMFSCNVIFPMSLWFKSVRRNMTALLVLSIFVNIGMWFERFVIIVTSLTRTFNPANWFYYRISITELALIVGSFAWFFMFFLVFVRVLPAFSIAEIKETLPMPKRRAH